MQQHNNTHYVVQYHAHIHSGLRGYVYRTCDQQAILADAEPWHDHCTCIKQMYRQMYCRDPYDTFVLVPYMLNS